MTPDAARTADRSGSHTGARSSPRSLRRGAASDSTAGVAPARRRRRGDVVRRKLIVADLAGLTVAFVALQAWLGSTANDDRVSVNSELVLFVAGLPFWIAVARSIGLYSHDEERPEHTTVDDLARVVALVTVSVWMIFVVSQVTGVASPDTGKWVIFWALAITSIVACRSGARLIARRSPDYVQNAVIVGTDRMGQLIGRKLLQHREFGIRLCGFVDSSPRELRPDLADSRAARVGSCGSTRPLEERSGIDRRDVPPGVVDELAAGRDQATLGDAQRYVANLQEQVDAGDDHDDDDHVHHVDHDDGPAGAGPGSVTSTDQHDRAPTSQHRAGPDHPRAWRSPPGPTCWPASVGRRRCRPTSCPFLGVIFALLVFAHVAIRRLAPNADGTLLPIAGLLNGLGYVFIARLDEDLAGLQATWTAVGIAAFVGTLFVVRRVEDLERYRYTFMVDRHGPAAGAAGARHRPGDQRGPHLGVDRPGQLPARRVRQDRPGPLLRVLPDREA